MIVQSTMKSHNKIAIIFSLGALGRRNFVVVSTVRTPGPFGPSTWLSVILSSNNIDFFYVSRPVMGVICNLCSHCLYVSSSASYWLTDPLLELTVYNRHYSMYIYTSFIWRILAPPWYWKPVVCSEFTTIFSLSCLSGNKKWWHHQKYVVKNELTINIQTIHGRL